MGRKSAEDTVRGVGLEGVLNETPVNTNEDALLEDLTSKMTEALFFVYSTYSGDRGLLDSEGLAFYYRLGSEFEKVAADKVTYGKEGVNLLRDALRLKEQQVRFMKTFVETYTEDELHELRSMEFSGNRVSWQHVCVSLVNYLTNEDRKAYFTRALKEGWSGKKLQQAIIQERGEPGSRQGRGHKEPTTFEGWCDLLHNLVVNLLVKSNKVLIPTSNTVLLSNVEENASEDSLATLIDLDDQINSTIDVLPSLQDVIRMAITSYKDELAKQLETSDDNVSVSNESQTQSAFLDTQTNAL